MRPIVFKIHNSRFTKKLTKAASPPDRKIHLNINYNRLQKGRRGEYVAIVLNCHHNAMPYPKKEKALKASAIKAFKNSL
jgi:hypothetical protein